jgi:hypothetical protein
MPSGFAIEHSLSSYSTLKMEAAGSSETLVNIIRSHIQGDNLSLMSYRLRTINLNPSVKQMAPINTAQPY